MSNSKLYEMLGGLKASEFKEFGEYLSSPFFNQSKRLCDFYRFLDAASSRFINCKNEMSRNVFPGEKYNEKKLTDLVYRFTRHLEKFLVLLESRGNKSKDDILLLRAFRKRNMVKNFESASAMFYRKRAGSKIDWEYYDEEADAAMESALYNYERSISKSTPYFNRMLENTDYDFMLKKLQHLYRIYMWGRMRDEKEGHRKWFAGEVIAKVENNLRFFKKEHPLIYSYYLITFFTTADNEKYYAILKRYIRKNKDKFTLTELRRIKYNMLNYCTIRIVNEGNEYYVNEAYDIYKFLEENSLFAEQGRIPWIDMQNIIEIGIGLDKVDWAEKMLCKYSDTLLPYIGQDTINLARAKILFCRKKYTDALNLIIHLNFPHYIYYLDAKNLLTRIYYETGEIESVLSVIDSLRHYLARKDAVPSHYKSMHLKFIKYMTRLVKLNRGLKNFKQTCDLLKHDIKNSKVLSEKWFIEMIEKH